MKAHATASETVASTSQHQVRAKQHGPKFAKALDGRKRPIRGLWERNGRYYAQLSVTDPATGRIRVQRIPLVAKSGEPAATVAQAVALMEGLRTKRRDTGLELQRRRAPLFADYRERYLDAIAAGEGAKKPRVIVGERAILGQWTAHLAGLRLDQVRKVHVNDYVTKRLKAGRSPRTCNLDVIVLRNLLKRAVDDGWLSSVPIDGLKPLKVTERKRELVSREDIDRVCTAACGQRPEPSGQTVPVTRNAEEFVDYLRFLQYTGAREKEALQVRWRDVDFDRRQVTIGAEGNTKNRTGRVVDFNPMLAAHLQDMKQRQQGASEWVFPSPQRGDKDIPARSFRESLNLARRAAGLPSFGFHDCRHHFISMCVMAGIDYMTIARWAGHRDGGVLIGKVYGHLSNEHAQRQAQKLAF